MWSPRSARFPLTMAGQILLLQVIVLLVVLAVASVVSLRQSDADFRAQRAAPLATVAQELANLDVVRTQIDHRPVLTSLTAYAEQFRRRADATAVYLADLDGNILVRSDGAVDGARLDSEIRNLDSQRSWSGDITSGGQRSIAALVPIFDSGIPVGAAGGPQPPKQVAVVVVVDAYPTLGDRAGELLRDLVAFLGAGLALGVAGSWLLARLVKRRTRGLEPADIAALADHREALLHAVREGVVAVGADGVITVFNDSARTLLGLGDADLEGATVADLEVNQEVRDLLGGEADVRDQVLVVGERVVVANRNQVHFDGRSVGAVTTLRDRTELLAMQSELTARESITETLRAQTHEFNNQLHIISGLVQLAEYDEVATVIGTITRRRAEINDAVTAVVHDAAVAALLVAKMSLAAERGIAIVLADDTELPVLDPDLSADVGTVLGNLIDNAVDATVSAAGPRIDLRLRVEADAVAVQVADTGEGVAADVAPEIFRRGWSTKPSDASGRGVGLALVQVICLRRGGHVSVHNLDGAVFTAVLPMMTRGG
ncbi:ATP-binding protein [Nocardioides sp. Bht2]|uniref:sensor histidine kinase n=1 Tax=Nocardioides sp. Bht2 TaxID=3392297 RepID=UPI0039B4ED12